MTRYISFASLLAVIVLLVILFYRVIASFLIPLFLAAILVVIFAPVHKQILEWTRYHKKIAAWLTTITILVVVLVPLLLLLLMAAAEGRELIRQFNAAETMAQVDRVRKSLGLDLPAADSFRSIQETFNEIQDTSAIDAGRRGETLRRHREALQKIRQSVERIAFVFGLPVSAEPIDESNVLSATEHQEWIRFLYELQQLEALRTEAEAKIDGEEGAEAFFQYLRQITLTHQAFSDFKTKLLGGKIWRWLKEQANPTSNDIDARLQPAVSWVRDHLFTFGASTTAYIGKFFLGLSIMVFALYFFLKDGPAMLNTLKFLSPIDDTHEQELIDEFARVTRAVVLATLLSAVIQAMLAGIGFYFVGLDAVFLLTLLTACAAIIPFIGAASVWVSCCVYLLVFENNTTAAIGLAIYGAVIVSMADNIVKPLVLHGQSNMHPLVALLSIIGGISALGPIGLLIGPMIVAFLQTVLNILHRELLQLDAPTLAIEGGAVAPTIAEDYGKAPPSKPAKNRRSRDAADTKPGGTGKRRRRRRRRRGKAKPKQGADLPHRSATGGEPQHRDAQKPATTGGSEPGPSQSRAGDGTSASQKPNAGES